MVPCYLNGIESLFFGTAQEVCTAYGSSLHSFSSAHLLQIVTKKESGFEIEGPREIACKTCWIWVLSYSMLRFEWDQRKVQDGVQVNCNFVRKLTLVYEQYYLQNVENIFTVLIYICNHIHIFLHCPSWCLNDVFLIWISSTFPLLIGNFRFKL